MLIETPQHTFARVARVCQRQLGFLVMLSHHSLLTAGYSQRRSNRVDKEQG